MSRRITSYLVVLIGLGLCLLSMIGLGSFTASRAVAAPLAQETAAATPAAPSTSPAQPTTPAEPAGQAQPTPEATRMPNLSISDEYCLGCHGTPGQTYTLENGDVLDLYVDPALHQNSVHGEMGYACVQCHTNVGEYPHPAWQAADRRDVTIQLSQVCARCHDQQSKLEADGVHASAQRAGIREAAVCADCHTAHEVRRLTNPETHELLPDTRQWIPERCALCHNAIYQKYKESVHGAALSEGNPDVPTCIDCHGVHNIDNPTTAYFRLRSPDICAKCHANEELMSKYGINTNVLNSYVADFHGTTVAIFEKVAPDAPVNKAVCYDCHGVHDISSVKDPKTGLEMQQNILKRCQVCHPDATPNFPSAWMSHYQPSPDRYPWVYYVNLFYLLFIPGVLGGMAILVVMDASRLVINRRKHRRVAEAQAGPAEVFAPDAAATDEAASGTAPEPPAETRPQETTASDPSTGVETDQNDFTDTTDTDSEVKHE